MQINKNIVAFQFLYRCISPNEILFSLIFEVVLRQYILNQEHHVVH
jgi:hypothetical protein